MATSQEVKKCPLCGVVGVELQEDFQHDIEKINCERCGRFGITNVVLISLRPEQKPLLSAYCRRQSEAGEPPIITSDKLASYINALPRYTFPEKLDNMLELMARMSPSEFGSPTTFNPLKDYPLLIMRDSREAMEFQRELQGQGYTRVRALGIPPILTMKGWERLEEIERMGGQATRAFVAMYFHDSTDKLYDDAIEPAIKEAGYDPLRIDKHQHVNRIDDEIIGQIKRSRFMVADFTGQRHGVYFEAGMMQGLGRNVIWMCDKKELETGALHFDVRQFNFVAYESVGEAYERLYQRILAIEGEGPHASTS